MNESNHTELLQQLCEQNLAQTELLKKQLRATRICAIVCALLLVATILLAGVLLPRLGQTLDLLDTAISKLTAVDWEALTANINKLAGAGQKSLLEVSDALQAINFESLNSTIEGLDAGQESLLSAAESLQSIDFAALNKAITDLGKVIKPLANLFG